MHNLPSGNKDMYFSMLLITGASRSGTGITGRILGSCENTIFSYEPAWLRAVVALMGVNELTDHAAKFLLEVCIHDVEFYPQLIGRQVNLRPGFSNTFNYITWDELLQRLALPDRKRDYDKVIKQKLCNYVFKLPDIHLVLGKLLDMFPQLKIIHLIRNGRDVIASGLKRQWYTDEFYNDWIVTWFKNSNDEHSICPWFVDQQYQARWKHWNQATRAAYGWCRMVRQGLEISEKYPDRVLHVRYEEMAANVECEANRLAQWSGLRLSSLSRTHINALMKYDQARYKYEFRLDGNVEEEFESMLKSLGY